MVSRALVRVALAALIVAAGLQPARALAQAVVVDFDAGTEARGALFRVDLTTGARTLVSDFGNPAQGPLGRNPFAITLAPARLVVLDQQAGTPCVSPSIGCGALFLVDPASGARTLLTDFGDPTQGPTGIAPYGIAAEASGDLLVTDRSAGGAGRGLLFRVSPADGTRTIVSNFLDPSQGPTGGEPSGISVRASGDVLVADAAAGTFPSGVVFAIDPGTGQRTILSDFTDGTQGPLGGLPVDVEPGPPGELWVADQFARADPRAPGIGQLFRVDPTTGSRVLVSDFSTAAQGPLGFNLNDVKPSASGMLLVIDFDAGTNSRGALFEVDPVTGSRRYLSDFGDAAQGPLGLEPSGFALATPPPPPPPATNTLTVLVQGAGNGFVFSNPPGIECGGDCSENYLPSQFVFLTPVTDGTSRFAGWAGDPECADGIVPMDADRVCIATFNRRGGRIVVGPDLTAGLAEFAGDFDVKPRGDINDPGHPYSVFVTLVNRGPLAAGPSLAQLYLSRDRRVSADDVLVAETPLPALPPGPSGTSVMIADDVLGGTQGRFYLILVLDAANVVDESDERNNVFAQRYEFPCGTVFLFAGAWCETR